MSLTNSIEMMAKPGDWLSESVTGTDHFKKTDVPDAEHELWHPHYLQAIATALDRLKARSAKPAA